MNNNDLFLRQQRLLLRSAQLRLDLAEQTQVLKKPFAWVDRLSSGALWVRRNPQWPVGLLFALSLTRPRMAWRWGSRLWWGWKAYARIRQWAHNQSVGV